MMTEEERLRVLKEARDAFVYTIGVSRSFSRYHKLRSRAPRLLQLFSSFDPLLAAEKLEAEISTASTATCKDTGHTKGAIKISVQPPTPWPVFAGVALAVVLAVYVATRGLIEERILI
jgi:hypothetical protein